MGPDGEYSSLPPCKMSLMHSGGGIGLQNSVSEMGNQRAGRLTLGYCSCLWLDAPAQHNPDFSLLIRVRGRIIDTGPS